MIYVVSTATSKQPQGVEVIGSRPTPAYVQNGLGFDYFCELSEVQAKAIEDEGTVVSRLPDGWYDLAGGGIAVWSDGRFWELRNDPFSVVRLGGEGLS